MRELTTGCILIPGYLGPSAQETLLTSALAEYTRPPNPLSLDTHYALPPDLFALYSTSPETPVAPRHLELDEDERRARAEEAQRTAGVRPLIETAPAFTMGYDEVKRRNASWAGDAMSLKAGVKTVEALMREIRWANLGWVYQVSSSPGRADNSGRPSRMTSRRTSRSRSRRSLRASVAKWWTPCRGPKYILAWTPHTSPTRRPGQPTTVGTFM